MGIDMNQKGVTLIEIMIVLAIVGSIVMIAIPKLNNRKAEFRSTAHKISVLSKELHTRAQLENMTYRMVIDLPGDGDDTEDHVYSIWVEKSNHSAVMFNIDEDAQLNTKSSDEEDEEGEQEKLPWGFQRDTGVLKKPLQLMEIFVIEDVELASKDDTIEFGRAYIHYLPQGLTEEAAIHVKWKGEELALTIAIHPLTGRADIIPEYIALEELRDQ